MNKRWTILNVNQEATQSLQNALKINATICSILVQRGCESFDEAKNFFRPSLDQMHDPFLMKDMQKAVDRIDKAITHREKILVYGDYDVDGTTSVAIMYKFLTTIHQEIDFYLPHRYREGYGVSKAGIDFAAENGFTLIVSLDCGIKSIALVGYAKSLGIDFIICDHHLPDEELPDAVAILNAKQVDCAYPFKELCGCGVGLKLIMALCSHYNLPDSSWNVYLDLTATAIAADIVPITGENRILAYFGLQQVNSNPSTGIKALITLGELKNNIQVSNLVFVIAPRVNAAGRMDDARKAVQLFIEQDEEKAMALAKLLQSDNSDRKDADKAMTEQALAMIDTNIELQQKNSTVLFNPGWHKGVVGIVASRLIEKHYRPTIVLTATGEKASGSARSVRGFNVYEAIHSCKDLLENYGGHFYAAGLTMPIKNVPLFQQRFEEVVTATIPPHLLIPEIIIDAEVGFDDLTPSFYNIISQLEPFGPENMRPVFLSKNVSQKRDCRLLKEAHLKFSLIQNNCELDGIGFNMAEKFSLLNIDQPIDIVYHLDQNEWNGQKSLQLKVIDFKISAS